MQFFHTKKTHMEIMDSPFILTDLRNKALILQHYWQSMNTCPYAERARRTQAQFKLVCLGIASARDRQKELGLLSFPSAKKRGGSSNFIGVTPLKVKRLYSQAVTGIPVLYQPECGMPPQYFS